MHPTVLILPIEPLQFPIDVRNTSLPICRPAKGIPTTHMSIVNFVTDHNTVRDGSVVNIAMCICNVAHMFNGKGSNALPMSDYHGADIMTSGPPVGPLGEPTAKGVEVSGAFAKFARIDGTMCANAPSNVGFDIEHNTANVGVVTNEVNE